MMTDAARDWWIRWGVCLILFASLMLSLLIDAASVYYRIPIIAEISRAQLVQLKLTFLSVLFVAGSFQYNYFYSAAEQFQKVISLNDYGPGWTDFWLKSVALRRRLASRQDATDPETESIRTRLAEMMLRSQHIAPIQ